MPRKKQHEIDAYIGARVRLRRLMLEMSQEMLGHKLGLTFQQVQKYERGINRISASRLFELATALKVPVSYFYDGRNMAPCRKKPNCPLS
jgi:transcriptional regulator with XRE-family HTH domain